MPQIRECNKCNIHNAFFLDAKYKKADLNKVMTEQGQHLNAKKRERLMILLRKFENLFYGTLGM